MRALIVGASSCGSQAAGLLRRLAAKADLVIAADGGADRCLDAGVKPDIVVGDFDSASTHALERVEDAGASIERYPEDKDESDLDLAIASARASGANRILLTCVTGGRFDHALVLVGSLVRAADLAPEIHEPSLSAWLLDAHHTGSLDVAEEGARLSVIPVGGPAEVTASGVRWPLENDTLEHLGSRGLSNVVEGGPATITVHRGTALVVHDVR
ncbi:MAG: thiamine diphosphokinase [Coriobacteriales bacterium]|nr:thiamine diphosphokinase [Coriobacteriales bacterium]